MFRIPIIFVLFCLTSTNIHFEYEVYFAKSFVNKFEGKSYETK